MDQQIDFRTTLLKQADEYCAAHGMSRRALAIAVMNDNKFFDRIEKGGSGFTTKTYEKFQTFFREGAV